MLRRQDALYGYSPEAYEAWIASLNLNPRNRDDVTALRMLNAAATTVDIDSAGRVALGKIDESDPQAREKLQLDRDVTIVGNGDHFEIWNTNSGTASSRQMTALQRSRTSSLAPSEARRS